MNGLHNFIDRYVQMWNETDASRRREHVQSLFAETAIRHNPVALQQGREQIERAVTASYQRFTALGFRFRPLDNALAHHDAIKFSWDMVDTDAAINSIGTTFLLLDDARQIRLDYQFTEHAPPPEVATSRQRVEHR